MKTYTFGELKKLSNEQGYKLAALESPTGQKVQSYNQLRVKVDKQLDKLSTRLNAEVFPDGVYTVLLAQSLSKTSQPDRYPVIKGDVKPEQIKEAEHRQIPLTPVIIEKSPDVLTYDKALEYQQTISTLQNQLAIKDLEIQKLKEDLAELEEDNEALSEKNTSEGGAKNFLSELMPQALPILDRYFDLEEKKLNLEAMKLGNKNNAPRGLKTRPIEPGTQPHLDLIERYYNNGNEERMNIELDRLEEANPDLYQQVCERLGLIEEGGDNE